ncbi:MAG: TatD family hydrolase [Deltaproteobacteria bacterium]|jgi:TatD DNase family protein|nr:TatD family hydrolase [Deltaproteobacteria bacterium]
MSKKKHHNGPQAPLPDPASFRLPRTGVESHAHLDVRHFDEDRAAVLERAKAAGVARIGQVFMSSGLWEKGKDYFLPHPEIFFLLSIHPTEAEQLTDEEYERLRAIIKAEPRVRAVGETGLDFYWKDCPPEVQKPAFLRLMHLAAEVKLPLSIHSRDATEETIALLRAEGFSHYPLVWHCFGGDAALAERILKLGWHISIPGPVTFPANQALREAVRLIPAERLMIETDCPYLAPMPCRGKRNEPAYLAFTIHKMAEARGEDPAALWTSCGQTAIKFFDLAPLE